MKSLLLMLLPLSVMLSSCKDAEPNVAATKTHEKVDTEVSVKPPPDTN